MSMLYEIYNPHKHPIIPKVIDKIIIVENLPEYRFAISCGNVIIAISNTTPDTLKHATIDKAVSNNRVLFIIVVDFPCISAYIGSYVTLTILGNDIRKNITTTSITLNKKSKSASVTSNMSPNKKPDKEGRKVGDKYEHITPTPIPTAQSMAMAESCLISFKWLNLSIPKDVSNPAIVAPNNGDQPNKANNPTPPNEAWAIPPETKTILAETIYVPIMPHNIPAITDAIKAF